MKKILNLAWNDIKIEFSDRSTLLFFFFLPVIFTAILGVSFNGNDNTDANTRWLLPVVVLDQSAFSFELVTELEKSEVLRPESQTMQDAQQLLKDGDVAAILIIHQGFEAELLSGNLVELELIKSPNDFPIYNPYWTAMNKIEDKIHKCLSEMGLSSTGLARIGSLMTGAAKKKSEMEELID